MRGKPRQINTLTCETRSTATGCPFSRLQVCFTFVTFLRVLRITRPFRDISQAPEGELVGQDFDRVLADAGALRPLLDEARASIKSGEA